MKIALITDTHWGVRNDSQVFLNYFKKFYEESFFKYLDENNIKSIIHLGDIVDRRKYINYVTLREFKQNFVEQVKKRNIDFHVIVGNHDIPYRNTNEVNAMREIFTHGGKEYVTTYAEPTSRVFDGLEIAFMPWISSGNHNTCLKFIETTTAQVLFGHLELAGFEMSRGLAQEHGYSADLFKNFDLVASGHYHHKSSKGNINYLGAPYEMTWHDYNDPRGFHIFDTDTRDLHFIANPYKMFYKIWYDDENKTIDEVLQSDYSAYTNTYVKVIVTSKTNPYWFDKFLDSLYKADPANVSIVDDNKNFDQLDEDEIINEAEDTLSIMSKYVDNVPLDVPKNDLNKLLQSLYTEAQSLDIH
tara:strand:- start:949 stop:2022 length:1074 start_codon:yes stop_codon:yes gene_type:complete